MAIRRPPTTFSDTISTADIADDAISGDKLANDIAISTTGNIATTGSGTLTVAGALTASGGIANAGTITAGTLGSNVVFPDGAVTNFIHKQLAFDSNTSYGNTSGGGSVVKVGVRGSDTSGEVPSFTAKQGYTYQIVYHFKYITDQAQSVNSSGRNTEFDLYYGTTTRSQGDTSFDTKLFSAQYGRDIASSSTANTSSKGGAVLMGAWYQSAANATTYVYFTGNATDNGKRVVVYHANHTPMHLFITEYKGNCSTILS